MMTDESVSPFVRRFLELRRAAAMAQGELDGWARGLVNVLETRGVEIDDDTRARIDDCDDVEQFEQWVSRAATADSVDDVFV